MLWEMAYVVKISVFFGWFWKASCILALSFISQVHASFRGWRAVRGRSLEILAPCSLEELSFLPVELMCFCFKVMSLQRLKMWCEFFQVVLSQIHFLARGVGDAVANTRRGWYHCMYHFLSGRCGCAGSLPVSRHLLPAQLPQSYGDLDQWTGPSPWLNKNTPTLLFPPVIYNLDWCIDLV